LIEPGIVLSALVPGGEQFFQHHRHLDAIRRGQRIELQRVLADLQFLVMGRAGDRPVDVGEAAAIALFPFPHLGGLVAGGKIVFRREAGVISHEIGSLLVRNVSPNHIGRRSNNCSRRQPRGAAVKIP
jgi:hypothetical protein